MKRLDGICPRTWRSLRTNNDKWIDDQLVATPFTALDRIPPVHTEKIRLRRTCSQALTWNKIGSSGI